MGEPIILYDATGNVWVTHSPSTADAAVAAGTHTRARPTHEQVAAVIDAMRAMERDEAVTPDDTQEVPVVPTGRARRKRETGTGVL